VVFVKSSALILLFASPVSGIIFFDGGSMPDNTETAPTGAFANSGWQHQLVTTRVHPTNGVESYLGTIISPKHYITAEHLGLGSNGTPDREIVVQPDFITGGAARTFTLKNGGNPQVIYWLDPEDNVSKITDLRIFEIWETFPSYAEIYSQSGSPDVIDDQGTVDEDDDVITDFAEKGNELVMTGYGDGKGTVVEVASVTKGWFGNPGDRKIRWGRNIVDGVATSSRGLLLYCDFDGVAMQSECQAANKDSGGAWFIEDGGTWKLAGINFAVDTYEYGPPNPGWNGFRAAIYSGAGLYHGTTDDLITVGSDYEMSHTYASRVSEHEAAINAIIQAAKDTALLPPEGRLGDWAADYGVTSETNPEDDPDKDGLTNLEEYLTESDPDDFKIRRAPLMVATPMAGTREFTLIETLDLVGRGITTTLQESSDLVNWTTVTGTTEDSNNSDPVLGIRTRVLSKTPAGNDEVYYRLKLEL